MKILQVISYFAPAWAYGGPVRVVYELSKELVKRGHQVTVFTTDVLDEKRRVKKEFDKIEGIKVYYFPTISNWASWHLKGFISPKMYFALDKKVRDFDIIHLHEFYTFQGVITPRLCQKYKVPYVFSGHGSVLPLPERGRQWIKKFYTLLWGKKIIKDAASLIALTQTEKKQYLNFEGVSQKIQVIPNGIDLDAFQKLPPKGKFRKRYNLPRDEKIILFLGRIYKLKGLERLIYSFAELRKHLHTVCLVIAGPSVNNYQKELEKIVRKLELQKKVIFTGFLDGQEKLSAFIDADVLVLPSLDDVFGVVILEAMACQLPVVATEGVGLSKIIDKVAGLKVKNNVKDLRRGLLRILQDQKLKDRFSKGGGKLVKKFNQKIIVDQIEQVYQELVK